MDELVMSIEHYHLSLDHLAIDVSDVLGNS
jgi:hypothetical protein